MDVLDELPEDVWLKFLDYHRGALLRRGLQFCLFKAGLISGVDLTPRCAELVNSARRRGRAPSRHVTQ